MRIAICGGTFDPIHRGHVEPVLEARKAFGWDRIFYIPAFRQPFKEDVRSASGLHRYSMTVLAVSELDGVSVSPMELERATTSYTVDTLRDLRARDGEAVVYDWVIGDDNLAQLNEWKSIDEIFRMANFVVLTRGKHEMPVELRGRASEGVDRPTRGAVMFARNESVEISATEVRERIRQGKPFEDLVHPAVAKYIHTHQLYQGAMI